VERGCNVRKMKYNYVKNELINSILSGIALLLSIGLNIVRWFSLLEVVILAIITISFGKNISQYFTEKNELRKSESTEQG